MRFGRTSKDVNKIMRHHLSIEKEKHINLQKPHAWFAWFPVCLDTGNWAWLETVTRFYRASWCSSVFDDLTWEDNHGSRWLGGFIYQEYQPNESPDDGR